MLDAQVFSLQARRALLQSLDLIPPQYTNTAGSAPAQVAAQGSAEQEAAPTPPHPSGRKLPSHSIVSPPAGSRSHKVRSRRDPGMQAAMHGYRSDSSAFRGLRGRQRFLNFSGLQAVPTAAAMSTTGCLHSSGTTIH
jgi:hypothetical protein